MEQLTWTLVALLGASTLGNLYYLSSKIDHLSARIDLVIGELGDLKGEVAALRTAFEMHVNDPHAHGR